MPHDKNKQVIEEGDGLRFADWSGKHRVGVAKRIHAATSCNVEIATPTFGGCDFLTVNADMCEVLTRRDGTLVAWVNPSVPADTSPTPAAID